MFMLRCAANDYRLAAKAAREGCSTDTVNRLLDSARYYDAQAQNRKG